jgi:hypothetical protein
VELPEYLYSQCTNVFLKSPYFKDYDMLFSFCTAQTEFSFLARELEKKNSQFALVTINLPILLKGKHIKYGWTFPIFVKALQNSCSSEKALWSELNDLYDKIQAIQEYPPEQKPTTSSCKQRLFKTILEIDFEEQQEEVTNALKLQQSLKRAAAFLIHGEEKFGQEILVHRLSQLSELRNGRRIKIKMAGMGDVSDLWNAIAAFLTGSNQVSYLSPDQVMALVSECLKTQHLIFIFTEIHRTCLGFLPELIEQFWQPIVDRVNLKETYLIMFLVDNKGKACQSGMPLAWQVCQPEYPKVPLHLPPTTRFLHNKISQWLRMAVAAEVVPESLSVETLLNESQGGVPELVYQRICYHCDCSWEGGLAQWLIQ